MRYIFLCYIVASAVLFGQTDKPRAARIQPDSLNKAGQPAAAGQTVLTDSSVVADSSARVDKSGRKKAPPDTIKFQQQKTMFVDSRVLADSNVLWTDYRNTAEYLRPFLPAFIRSLGTTGQPEEFTLNGLGYNELSIYEDGLLNNDRTSNTQNFNALQGESYEKIEVLPLPRGFMAGPVNNIAGINFISSNRISPVPYTRIRFYQAPYQEGFFDFRQQQLITRRLSAVLELTNRKKDLGYTGSNVSSWLGSLSLMYAANKELTLKADYKMVKDAPGLFGGVNVDTLKLLYKDPTAAMYDNLIAPIMTADRYSDQYQNLFRVSALYFPSGSFSGDATVYFRENLVEFRLNKTLADTSGNRLSFNRISKLYGAQAGQKLLLPAFTLSLNEGIEKSTGKDNSFIGDPENHRFFVSSTLEFDFLGEGFKPAAFVKLLKDKDNSYYGYGADIFWNSRGKYSLYAGMSQFEKYNQSAVSSGKSIINTFEVRAAYNPERNISYTVSLYYYRSADSLGGGPVLFARSTRIDTINTAAEKAEVLGGSLALRHKMGFILLEGSANFIIQKSSTGSSASVPGFFGSAGIYYNNIHFDSSLDVKAGFNTNFYSAFTPKTYDLFFLKTYTAAGTRAVSGGADLNFFMAGEIKKLAIIYFTWENLLGRNYYLTPYYPMPDRGLRLGVAWQLFN